MSGVAAPARWQMPEQLLGVGFERSRLVLVNEAHSWLRRSIRTRQIGIRLVNAVHDLGVRHLAMEALYPHDVAARANQSGQLPRVEDGYLAQPEMRELIHTALGLGWTLVPYEADLRQRPPELERLSRAETNWREDQQAHNIAQALADLPADTRLLVWCGNGHLSKRQYDDWRPMGLRLSELCGFEPFAIDQVSSIRFMDDHPAVAAAWAEAFKQTLDQLGGTAGFLAEDAPHDWPRPHDADAYLISTDNQLT